MVRGTVGVKRSHTISVRVSEAEWAVWEAARGVSGRAEMGAWVRAVVGDVVDQAGGLAPGRGRPGDVPRVPQVNAEAYAQLVAAGNNLNQLTRYSHAREELAEGVPAAVAEVVAAAREVRGLGVPPSRPAPKTTPVRAPTRAPASGSSRSAAPPAAAGSMGDVDG